MSIINSISKKDAKWRQIAFNICKNKDDADDLVQEMYLRLYNYDVERWNYSFIILVLWNLFKDSKKSKYKTTEYLDEYETVTNNEKFSFNDRELFILSQVSKLSDDERKLLELNYDLSTCKIANNLDICRIGLHRKMIKIRKKVLKNGYNKEYNNRRFKHRK